MSDDNFARMEPDQGSYLRQQIRPDGTYTESFIADGEVIWSREFDVVPDKWPTESSAEQQASDLLERYGVEEAQYWLVGDLVELANVIADANAYRRQISRRSAK